jgi:hypothetical protein
MIARSLDETTGGMIANSAVLGDRLTRLKEMDQERQRIVNKLAEAHGAVTIYQRQLEKIEDRYATAEKATATAIRELLQIDQPLTRSDVHDLINAERRSRL